MSVTESYKTVTMSRDLMFQVQLALEARVEELHMRGENSLRWPDADRVVLAEMGRDTAYALAAVKAAVTA